MSIEINLDVMMAIRKIKLKELSKQVGISEVNLSILNAVMSFLLSFQNYRLKTLGCQDID